MTEHKRLDGMRVGVMATDGFEQIELTMPRKLLEKLGAETEIVSVHPGRIRGMNLMYPEKSVRVDRVIEEAEVADYDALLLPGGFVNPDFMRQSQEVLEFLRAFDRTGKPIAVLCHGPQILISAGLVKERRLTSWPSVRVDIVNAGGVWEDSPLVRDRNWVSSRGPQDMLQFQEGMASLFAEHLPTVPRQPRRSTGAGRWAAGTAAAAILVAGGTGLAWKASRGLRRLSRPKFLNRRATVQRRNEIIWSLVSSIVLGGGIVAALLGQQGPIRNGSGGAAKQSDASKSTPGKPRRTPGQAEGERHQVK